MGDLAVSGSTLLGAKRPRKTTVGSTSTDSSSGKKAVSCPGEPKKRAKKQSKVSEQASLELDEGSLSDDDDLSDIDKEKG